MADIEFCPFCNASAHKLILCRETTYYCKECSKFFEFSSVEMHCTKCNSPMIKHSEFPMPDGSLIFQCQRRDCKKMMSARDLFEED